MQHAVDENSRRRDFLRIERAELDDVLALHDGQLRRRRHHRVEIARRRLVGEIAPAVRFPGLDQRDVAVERFLENIFAAVNLALFLAGGKLGADRRRGIERRNAGTGGAHALRHGALRHAFELDLAFTPQPLEHHRIGSARERADDFTYTAGIQELGETEITDAGIIGDHGEVLGALLDQAFDQRVRLADAAEAADQHDRTVTDAGHGLGHGLHDLVDHCDVFTRRSSLTTPSPLWGGWGVGREGSRNRRRLHITSRPPPLPLPNKLALGRAQARPGWGRGNKLPNAAHRRGFGKVRHHLAGEAAQAVAGVTDQAAAVEQYIFDAEPAQIVQLHRDLVGIAVERALFARLAGVGIGHDAGGVLHARRA